MQSKRLEQYLQNKTSRWHTLDAGCRRYIHVYHKHLILTFIAAWWLQMVQLFKHSVTFTDAIQLRASYYHPVNINKRYIVTSWITANMQSSCNVPKSQFHHQCLHELNILNPEPDRFFTCISSGKFFNKYFWHNLFYFDNKKISISEK